MNSQMNRSKGFSLQCDNLGSSIQWSATINLFIVAIVCIMLLVTVIYNYAYKGKDDTTVTTRDGDTSNADKKTKVVAGLTITATVFSVFALIFAVWNRSSVATAASTCLEAPKVI